MTDNVKGCYVSFDRDYRIDDVQPILNAIHMVKHVSGVEVENHVTDPDDWMARERVAHETLMLSMTVLRASLTGGVGFCSDKPKIIGQLEQILHKLKESKG